MKQKYNCPICNSTLKPVGRYPNYICGDCKGRVTNDKNQQVRFSQKIEPKSPFGEDNVIGKILETNEKYNSDSCWIDGIKCTAQVARFGGIVIQTDEKITFQEKPNKILVLRGSVIVDELDLDEELKNCPDSTKENENSIDRLLAFYNSPKYQALNDEELEALTSGKTPLLTYRLKYPRARRRNSDINYVDEAGRPVDISEIDMDLARFYDEWGRSVDYSGELIITVGSEAIPESQIINAAEKMIIKNKYHQLVKHCAFYLEDESHSKNPRILYLLGFGFANLRNIQRARETFLESILANLPQIDSMVFVNYITSCFDLSDKDSALKMIEQYFEDFDSDCKKMVLESLLEAVRTKLVSISDLSQKMRILLEIGESFGADSRFKDNFKFSDVLMGSVVGYWKFLLRTVPERAEDVRSFFLNGGVTLLIEVQKETLTPLVEAFLELKPEIGNNEIEIDMLIELFRVINISFQSLAAEWAQVPEIDREDYVHSSDELRRLLRVYLSFDFALQTFRRQTQNVH